MLFINVVLKYQKYFELNEIRKKEENVMEHLTKCLIFYEFRMEYFIRSDVLRTNFRDQKLIYLKTMKNQSSASNTSSYHHIVVYEANSQ